MRHHETRIKEREAADPDDRAILEAMDEIAGYLDITPEDFLDILHHAQKRGIIAGYASRESQAGIEGEQEKKEGQSSFIRSYFNKFRSTTVPPKRVHYKEIIWSWIGSFFGILAVAWLQYGYGLMSDAVLIVGSFGASAVLIYGATKSPFAQPRNLVGGHVVSALVGSLTYMILPDPIWLTAAIAVATAVAGMHLTRTVHPPGGATALIAVIGSDSIHALGLWYALVPVGLGVTIMLIIAVLINNLAVERDYPEYWF